jgi:hypothetical protein
MGAEEKRHPCRDRNRERSTLPWGKGWLLSGPKITTKPWWRGNFLASGTIFQGCDREDFTGWDFSSIKPDAKLCPTGEGERGRCTPDDDANKYLVRWSYGLPVNNLCLPSRLLHGFPCLSPLKITRKILCFNNLHIPYKSAYPCCISMVPVENSQGIGLTTPWFLSIIAPSWTSFTSNWVDYDFIPLHTCMGTVNTYQYLFI